VPVNGIVAPSAGATQRASVHGGPGEREPDLEERRAQFRWLARLANGRLFVLGQDLKGKIGGKNEGLMSVDASNGRLVWLNPTFESTGVVKPTIVANNGGFGQSTLLQ
jgi:hypothetical protein